MKQFVNIFLNRPTSPLKNFWSNIHFHPTDAIEDEWGQAILNDVARDHAANMVRMYTMFEDIVTQNPDGSLHYDYTLNDQRMDYMISKGFRLFVSYNFIPPFLASDPDEYDIVAKKNLRYKGKHIGTSAPKDYAVWEEICRNYTQHIVDRYGLERVASWQLQCYNEPDSSSFFMNLEPDTAVRVREYCKLYRGFANAVKGVSDRLQIGGPSISGYVVEFLDLFLKFIHEEQLPLDFVSCHTYGTDPKHLNRGDAHFDVHNHLPNIYRFRELMETHEMGHLPLVLDEWGMSTLGFLKFDDCSQLIVRETEMFPAYYGKMLTLFDELNINMDNLLICLSGQHGMAVEFTGSRGFFTLSHIPRPIYFGYVLGARLGNRKLQHDMSSDQNLAVMPTICEDGTIQILLSYADRIFNPIDDLEITLNLKRIDSGYNKVEITRIDKDHANAFRYWQSRGYGNQMTADEIDDVKAHAVLVPEAGELLETDGTKHIKVTVPFNSMTLITIH